MELKNVHYEYEPETKNLKFLAYTISPGESSNREELKKMTRNSLQILDDAIKSQYTNPVTKTGKGIINQEQIEASIDYDEKKINKEQTTIQQGTTRLTYKIFNESNFEHAKITIISTRDTATKMKDFYKSLVENKTLTINQEAQKAINSLEDTLQKDSYFPGLWKSKKRKHFLTKQQF